MIAVSERLVQRGVANTDGLPLPVLTRLVDKVITAERVAQGLPVRTVVELQLGCVLQLLQYLLLVAYRRKFDNELVDALRCDRRFGDSVRIDPLLKNIFDSALSLVVPFLTFGKLGSIRLQTTRAPP
jgi:hypothetical protein